MYVADLKKRLAKFCAEFGGQKIAGITVEELDNWLRNLDCGPKSRANFRANVGVMFSYRGAPESDRQQSGSANCTAKACR